MCFINYFAPSIASDGTGMPKPMGVVGRYLNFYRHWTRHRKFNGNGREASECQSEREENRQREPISLSL